MTVTLTTNDVTAERLNDGDMGDRTWMNVAGDSHTVFVWRLHSGRYCVLHTVENNDRRWRAPSVNEVYETPIAALAAFHAIGPGIHPPRLLTERETQEP